jgi:hypothetical protein
MGGTGGHGSAVARLPVGIFHNLDGETALFPQLIYLRDEFILSIPHDDNELIYACLTAGKDRALKQIEAQKRCKWFGLVICSIL